MGAAFGRGHGVAIGAQEAVLARDPRDRPFDGAMAVLVALAGEHVARDHLLALDAAREKILEPAREVKHGAFGRLAVALKLPLGASPADLDAAEEIGLGARHAEQARGLEARALAEDLGVGPEADLGAAPVLHRRRPSSAGRRVSRAYRPAGRASARAPPPPRAFRTVRWRPRRRRRAGRRSCHRPWS